MAYRLMTVDASRHSFIITCECGHRAMSVSRDGARELMDRHRADAHPRQATYVASKRRTRAR